MGLLVTGSEIVGLVPKEAIYEAGKYYLKKQNKTTGVPEKEIIDIAVKSLGLDSVSPFEPDEKIIEYIIAKDNSTNLLTNLTINDFADEVSVDSPAPGGGSVAALGGALSSALSAMVSALSYNKKGYEDYRNEFINLGEKAQKVKDEFLKLVDEDTNAFNKFMAARKLPKKTDEEKAEREKALEEAAKYAAEIPLKVLETSVLALQIAERVSEIGNKNSISDAGVAGWMGRAAAEGAYLNVKINLPSISDENFRNEIISKAGDFLEEARKINQRISVNVLKALEE